MAWGEDGLHRRGNVWYVSYRDDNGKQREVTTRTRDYKEAKKFRAEFMERLRQGQLPTDMADWKLGYAVEKYNEWRKATAAPKTAATEKTLLRPVVAFFGAEKRLRRIKAQDLRDYQAHRSSCVSPTMKRTVQPRSINYEMFCLITILRRANLWHGELACQYKRLRQAKPSCGRALTPEDGLRLAEAAKSEERWMVAFCCSLLAYATGCRSWEIKTLQLGSIDVQRRELVVLSRYAKNRQQREVALNGIAMWAINRLLERAAMLGATAPDHYLLPHSLSGHTKPNDPERGRRGYDPSRHQTSWASAWRSLRTAAGLPAFRFHDLRHTFNSQGAENGAPIEVLMSQAGHLDPAMSRHYTHISTKAKHQLVATIEAANGGLLRLLTDDAGAL